MCKPHSYQAKAEDQWLQTDNGSEFISKSMDLWAYKNRVTVDSSRPGKPTDNAFIESFNDSCGMNIWTCTGSCFWKIRRRKSNTGGRNIIIFTRILHLITWLWQNLPKPSKSPDIWFSLVRMNRKPKEKSIYKPYQYDFTILINIIISTRYSSITSQKIQ